MDFTKDIYINKDKIYENQEIVLLYKGFLFSNNLTNEVYIAYGYGDKWERKSEIKMKPSTFGYLATIPVESGENLQFCFRNNNNQWDNNNYSNYILPIQENDEVLSFKTLSNTTKEVKFEVFASDENEEKKSPDSDDIFETSILSSNSVEFYKTVDLENISKPTIPDDTIVTQIKLDYINENENLVQEAVIKSETPKPSTFTVFSEITEKAKAESVKAFDENNVTTGSLYVNSIVKDLQDQPKQIENLEEKSLIQMDNITPIEKITSFFDVLFKGAKTAFSKLIKLIKTSLNFNEDEN